MEKAAKAVAALCVLALIGSGIFWTFRSHDTVKVSADFPSAIGLYPGSDVRVLGVKIGTVDKIQPVGTRVHVEFSYDAKYKVPADAGAVIVAPSLVADRYVQLTPVYTGGAALADGATVKKTAVPVELDQIYETTNQLTEALAPDSTGKNAALERLLKVGAANLDGNGATLNQTLEDFSGAVQVLGENRENLFGTVDNLQKLTTALAASDGQVRQFNDSLSTVAGQLADERQSLGATLSTLATALQQVTVFVRDNRAALKKNITGLAQVTGILVKERDSIARFGDLAPLALSNLARSYNPVAGTLDARANLQYLQDPTFLCSLLVTAGVSDNVACNTLSKLLGGLPQIPGVTGPISGGGTPQLPGLPVLPGLPTLPTGGSSGSSGPSSGTGAALIPGLPGLPALGGS